jgi:hypothetical protein
MNGINLKTRLVAGAVTSAAALFLVAAPSASAGVLVKSATNCVTSPLVQPFTQWGDSSNYVAAPDGSFENGADGWTLNRAAVESGNESYYVGGSSDSRSLQISNGGWALTPTICVGLDRPTLRFFARSSGGLLGGVSTMAVSVRFETSLGLVAELPIGVVLPSGKWGPSLPMPILANLLPLLPGDMTPVQFRFTPIGGTYSIDDVYVDPKNRA